MEETKNIMTNEKREALTKSIQMAFIKTTTIATESTIVTTTKVITTVATTTKVAIPTTLATITIMVTIKTTVVITATMVAITIMVLTPVNVRYSPNQSSTRRETKYMFLVTWRRSIAHTLGIHKRVATVDHHMFLNVLSFLQDITKMISHQ